MMRLQRGLLRSDAVTAGAGAGEDGSAFGLFFGVVFAAAVGDAAAGCVESGAGVAGAPAATPEAGTGGAGSDVGAMPVEDCESPTVLSDAGGTAACFGAGGVTAGSIVV